MLKPSRIAMVAAATAGIPYAFSDRQDGQLFSLHGLTGGESAVSASAGHEHGLTGAAGGVLPPGAQIEGVGIQHISQVIRFDLSLPWVLSTWPRVTTGLADPSLQGYRVPVVTGTRPTDVAGSLTYYFNKQQQVERILLHGSTGDPVDVITFLNNQYGFRRIPVSDAGLHLYQRSEGERVTGELRIRALGVVRQDTPLNRWDISLVLDRPQGR